jgi:hypothetical protein
MSQFLGQFTDTGGVIPMHLAHLEDQQEGHEGGEADSADEIAHGI